MLTTEIKTTMKKLFALCSMLCVAFAAQAVEFLHGPYVQAVTEDSAYIVWVTDKASYGWVEVKSEGEKKPVTYIESHLGLRHNRRVHRVPVKNLKAGALYQYEIFSQQEEKGGKLSKPISLAKAPNGKPLSFRTNDQNKEEISFLMVTDVHYNNYVEGLFSSLITPERLEGKDFVVFNGDMVTTMSSEKTHHDRLFTSIHNLMSDYNKFFYYVRGNHESRGNFAQKYMDYYPTWTGMPYYAFRHGPVFFIVIDGGEDKPDSDIEYYGTAAFDLYRQAEGEWLQTVLDSEEFKTATYRVILSHIPLTDNSWHGGRHAWKHLCQRCEDKGINLMISGHIHKYRFYDKGVHNQTFPTVVIGADKFVDATADKESMTIAIKNADGSVHKEFKFPATK